MYWVLAQESSLLLYAIGGIVFVILDVLNIYWLYSMSVRFVEKVKMMGEKKHIL